MPSHSHSGSTNTAGSHNHSVGHAYGVSWGNGTKCTSSYSGDEAIYTSTNGEHSHVITLGNTGSGLEHNNIQPYLVVYIWKRIN